MCRHFNHLSYTKRLQLEGYLNAGISKKEIAILLNVHISTIYREIKRGNYEHLDGATWLMKEKYSSDLAESKYRSNLSMKGGSLKIGNDYEFANYIERRIIHDKLSPLAVIGEIERKGLTFNTSICVSTLYNYIRKNVFESLDSKVFLRKKRGKVVAKKNKRAPRGTSIEMRPKEINDRNIFGHWEMDCVCGSSLSTLLVLTERLSRKEIIIKMPNRTSRSVVESIDLLEKKYGNNFNKIFKTITVDNGVEFSDVKGLERSCINNEQRTKMYYCHPYSSYERGTNERINREIRRMIPKGSDISKYSSNKIKKVEKWVNNYPRQIFNFSTSQEIYDHYIKLLN